MGHSKALLLLSGGLDSAVTCALAQAEGFEVSALTINYGQRHSCELQAAAKVANFFTIKEHQVLDFDMRVFGGSALTAKIDVPKNMDISKSEIPVTYVPARNALFLTMALAWAEPRGVFDIFIGVNNVDYSGYPDCRPEFIAAYEKMANLATKSGCEGKNFTIHTPLIGLSKAEVICKGNSLGVDFSLTHSCYDPDNGRACGACESCLIRKKAFADSAIADPTKYA